MRASSIYRYALCPGSLRLEKEANVHAIPEAAIAESGTAIHAALAGEPIRELTDDEEYVRECCADAEATLVMEQGEPTEVLIEEEITLPTKFGEISGHPDKGYIFEEQGLGIVIDYKTGYIEVPDASRNLQLRVYALMLKKARPHLQEIECAILQPRTSGTTVLVTYSKQGLADAWAELGVILSRAHAADAPLVPSPEACKYCPAQTICPAARKELDTVAKTGEISEADWMAMPAEKKVHLWDTIKLAEGVIANLKEQFRADLQENPECFDGQLVLGTPRNVRKISDPVKAFQSVATAGVDADAFAACCTVGLAKLEDALRAATGLKGKALKAKSHELLDDVITTNETQSPIERRKA